MKNLYLHIGLDYAEMLAGNDSTLFVVQYPSKEQIALLRLFVAAPDMLASLKGIHAHLANGDNARALMMELARAAIAKAGATS